MPLLSAARHDLETSYSSCLHDAMWRIDIRLLATESVGPLMVSDQGPVVQSALLRSELIQLRKDCGLTQQQVAGAMEWSTSKLIRVEGGASSITKVDLDALVTMYRVTSDSQRERLHALNRGAKEAGWW